MALRPHNSKDAFPPLPQIRSKELAVKVFTHRSVYARPTHIFEDHAEDPSPDNERLEHLGDAVLSLVVTELLSTQYRHLRVGPATKIRALIIGNATLAEISVAYNLQAHLRLHQAQTITLKASTKIQADVFEAYIGGLYLDQGLDIVKKWLCALLRPYATEAYRIVRGQHCLPVRPIIPLPASNEVTMPVCSQNPRPSPQQAVGHLAYFNQCIQQRRKAVEWRYDDLSSDGTKSTPIWIASAFLDNRLIGRGQGGTKKAAQNEAAKLGLKDLGVYY